MEIFYCKLAQAGFCTSGSETLPTGAINFVGGLKICTQASSNDQNHIKCDKKEITSTTIVSVDSGDGAGPS